MVSAGVKSILDVPASLERLETLSITVIGFRTRRFPGFYLADSGMPIQEAIEEAEDLVAVVSARDEMEIPGAIVLANPVPADHQLDPAEHDRVLADAWAASGEAEISGHDATPFLLDYIQRATQGRSLEVNVAVYENNVALAARVATALASAAEVGSGR
jgi:pseudouridine-5'-phosphate glycosidase